MSRLCAQRARNRLGLMGASCPQTPGEYSARSNCKGTGFDGAVIDLGDSAPQGWEMTLATRIRRVPLAFDPATASDVRAGLPGLEPEVL